MFCNWMLCTVTGRFVGGPVYQANSTVRVVLYVSNANMRRRNRDHHSVKLEISFIYDFGLEKTESL
jgi:hypothetical protein